MLSCASGRKGALTSRPDFSLVLFVDSPPAQAVFDDFNLMVYSQQLMSHLNFQLTPGQIIYAFLDAGGAGTFTLFLEDISVDRSTI
jgi:hypothetical protein